MPPKGGTKKAKKTGREIFDSQFDIDVEVDNGEHYREICSDREIREDRVHFEALRDFGNLQKKMKKWTCNFYFFSSLDFLEQHCLRVHEARFGNR